MKLLITNKLSTVTTSISVQKDIKMRTDIHEVDLKLLLNKNMVASCPSVTVIQQTVMHS